MFTGIKNRQIYLLLTVFAAVVYFVGLFVDIAGDAAKYGAIAKNIFHSGDYFNLSIHDDPYKEKPPFLFWLSTLGYCLFGVSNFSYKFFPVLYGFFGIFCVYKLGTSMYDKRTGQIAALLLAFSEIYYLYSVDVHTDIVLLSNMAFALWHLYEYLKNKKTLNFILGFAGVGLSMMTKGPIGVFVPATAVIFYLIFNREYKQLIHPKWFLGLAITFATAIPAFYGLYNQLGLEGLEFFFWTNNFGRIAGTYVARANTDYFFYLHTLLYLFAPWGFVLFIAVFLEMKSLLKKQALPADYFLHGGIWFFFIILSIAKGKSPNYILIVMPLLTVLLAKWLNRLLSDQNTLIYKIVFRLQAFVVVLLWICLFLFITYLFPLAKVGYWLIVIPALAMTYYMYSTKKDGFIRFFAPSMLIITLLSFFINSHILPYIFQYQSSIVATRKFNKEASQQAQLFNYDYEQFELFFYGRDGAELIEDTTELKIAVTKPNAWIFCYGEGLNDIKKLNTTIDTIYQFKHRGVYRTGIQFILPSSREHSLKTTYLVKTK
ncbi:glycosyltransferase family 39 protein [uncultured Sunxiuqinia sp.]|uniref:ArnT family glycosyltransferase n=1 Tax=uncultured Sunxiuqinia sp. TaxID=1573825 RepID=UPI002AA8C668|nr:glycosyltransferase family 39 protein [uncultured Sunxiuqinia sp.]